MHSRSLPLSFRTPLCPDNLFGHLAATAVPGVEEWRDGAYRRTVRLPRGPGVVALRPGPDQIDCTVWATDSADLDFAVRRCRWLLDLDADPAAIDERLRTDSMLRPLVDKVPGRRVPRMFDGPEFAVRAVIGQQVSTAAARTHAGRLVVRYGEPLADPAGGLTHLFPGPETLAGMDPADLAFPRSRRTTMVTLVRAIADGVVELTPQADPERTRAQLAALPGIGPWTVEAIAMRALGDPDAFPATDLGVRHAARQLGLPERPRELIAWSRRWQPWRAYAVQHLWATGDHAINRLPD